MKIISSHNLFEFELPEGWEYLIEDEIYSLFNESTVQGVLQISAYFSKENLFNVSQEFVKMKKERKDAIIVYLGKNVAIHYALLLVEDNLIRYDWIIASSQRRIFCTFLVNSSQKVDELDSNYNQVVEILSTIKWIKQQSS